MRFLIHGQEGLQQHFEREFEDLNWFIPIEPETDHATPVPESLPIISLNKEDVRTRLLADIPIKLEGDGRNPFDQADQVTQVFLRELQWLIALQKQTCIWSDELESIAVQKAQSLIRVYSRLKQIPLLDSRTESPTHDQALSKHIQGIHYLSLDIYAFKALALFEAKYWREMHLLQDPLAFYHEAYALVLSLNERSAKDLFLCSKRSALEGLNEIFWGAAHTFTLWTSGAHQRESPDQRLFMRPGRYPSLWRDNPETMGIHLEVSNAVTMDLPIEVPHNYRPKMFDLLQLAHLMWIGASDPALPNTRDMKLSVIDALLQSLHTYGSNQPSCKKGTENRLALSLQHLHPLLEALQAPLTSAQFWSLFPSVVGLETSEALSKVSGKDWHLCYESDTVWQYTAEMIAKDYHDSQNHFPFEAALQLLLDLDLNGRAAVIEHLSSLKNQQ